MTSKLTFHDVSRLSFRCLNVTRSGTPWASTWTWEAEGETHPWHAKITRSGEYRTFRTLEEAKAWLEGEAA